MSPFMFCISGAELCYCSFCSLSTLDSVDCQLSLFSQFLNLHIFLIAVNDHDQCNDHLFSSSRKRIIYVAPLSEIIIYVAPLAKRIIYVTPLEERIIYVAL